MLAEAHSRFAQRYYFWALAEFRAEVDSGFHLLRCMDCHASSTCLRVMSDLDMGNRRMMADALVKRFHGHALSMIGETVSPQERALLRRYYDAIAEGGAGESTLTTGMSESPVLSPRRLSKALMSALEPLLGNQWEPRGGGLWRAKTPIGSNLLCTYIDVGGRFHRLSYWHEITCNQGRIICQSASVLAWLGLSAQTKFRPVSEGSVERTLSVMVEICARFVGVAPSLLA